MPQASRDITKADGHNRKQHYISQPRSSRGRL